LAFGVSPGCVGFKILRLALAGWLAWLVHPQFLNALRFCIRCNAVAVLVLLCGFTLENHHPLCKQSLADLMRCVFVYYEGLKFPLKMQSAFSPPV
jgi:hypothetical protein